MSSNRVITDSNGRQFSADSFDRFGDDLTELILSYLTLEDKIRLQCVSKQWQRLIFNKQYVLKFCTSSDNIGFNDVFIRRLLEEKEIFYNLFKKLLQDCTIRRIDFGLIHLDHTILHIISECCPLLDSIAGNFSELNRMNSMEKFGKKFSNQIKGLHFRGQISNDEINFTKLESSVMDFYLVPKNESLFITFCPNVEDLSSSYVYPEKYRNLEPMSKLKKWSLKTRSLNKNVFQDINRLAPNLKNLEIVTLSYMQDFNQTISSFSPLLNIVVFKMIVPYLSDEGLINITRLMPNLQVLKTRPTILVTTEGLNGISKNCKITELILTLDFKFGKFFNDKTFEALFVNLPKLKKIRTNNMFRMTDTLITELIGIANNRQNEKIIFECKGFENQFTFDSSKLPNNLEINFIS